MAKFTVTSTTAQEPGIWTTSADGEGIHAESDSTIFAAVAAIQLKPGSLGAAVYAECRGDGNAIHGETEGNGHAILAYQKNPSSDKAGIYAEHINGTNGTAGFFKGNVIVTGDISFPGEDCAEHFTIEEEVEAEPGTVMALSSRGLLIPTARAYERKVVGVIAGAGSFRSGIVLGNQKHASGRRRPVALAGKVYCKADARYGPIEVGDLLTSSETVGHAMRASDPGKAFGAVIGKAMAPLAEGIGLVPAIVALQ